MHNRKLAAEKIADESVRIDVIKSIPDWTVRQVLIDHLWDADGLKAVSDEDFLEDIVCNHSDWEMRTAALFRLKQIRKDSPVGGEGESCRFNIFWDGFWEGQS